MEHYTIQEIVKALQENENENIDKIVWYLLKENEELRREAVEERAKAIALREANAILQQIAMVQKKGE